MQARNTSSLLLAFALLSGCSSEAPQTVNKTSRQDTSMLRSYQFSSPIPDSRARTMQFPYQEYAQQAARQYGVDERLVMSIIEVESGFNPAVVSKSNAIGLMQIKSSTSGKDVFMKRGIRGEPSRQDLMDPQFNIDIGTAYLGILKEQQLAGIEDEDVMRYAMIVAYVNGAGALLRTFSSDRSEAIRQINKLTAQEFYQHVQKKHPAPQAPRYLYKVNTVYTAQR